MGSGFGNMGVTMQVRYFIVLGLGAVFAAAVLMRVEPLNGPWYWKWPWRDLSPFLVGLYLLPPLLGIGFVVWRSEREATTSVIKCLLAILVLASFTMQVGANLAEPDSFLTVQRIVMSPAATSYFTDASEVRDLDYWLKGYPGPDLRLHSSTHPPGPILFYYFWISLLGPEAGATVGGCAVGLIGSLGILILYRLAALWTDDVRERLTACAFYSLMPALILFFPEFAQAYPIASMPIAFFWIRSLQGRLLDGLWLGITLFAAAFFAYNLLAMGAFMVLYALSHLHRSGWRRDSWLALGRSSLLSMSTCFLLFSLLMLLMGYDPIHSFRQALANQGALAARLARPYAACLFFDLYDFALGAGIMAVPLAFFHLRDGLKEFRWDRQEVVLSLVGILTILAVDLTGLLRAETARVWLFLQPFLVLPAALELARSPRVMKYGFFALQWLIVVALKSRMAFIQA